MKNVKSRGRIAFFMVLFLTVTTFLYAASPINTKTTQAAANFSLNDIKENAINLSDFKGKAVILFFWTTWCPYCRQEFPALAKEYVQMKAQDIYFLAINIGEPKNKVENFLRDKNVEFPVLLDPDSRVAKSYGLVGVPTFILVDSSGFIKFMGNELPAGYDKIIKSN